MYWYLAIITTILVVTQIVRVTQNAISLHHQSKVIDAQLDGIKDVTNEDLDRQRRVYKLAERYLTERLDNIDDFDDDDEFSPANDTKYIGDNDAVHSCPRCGGRNIYATAYIYPYPDKSVEEWILFCEDCDCESCDDSPTEELAIKAWNDGECG